MAQASPICPTTIHFCAIRATRLDTDGSLAAGPNNAYVSNSPVMLGINPNVVAGESKQVISGCDCICVSYKGPDKLLRFDLDLELCALEPGLIEMLTGSALVTDDSTSPVAIGNSWSDQLDCSASTQPPVAIEAWASTWLDDAQAPAPYAFTRYVFPMTFWQLDAWQVQNDFLVPKFKGWTRSNALWPSAGGIYDDYPAGAELGPLGGYFWDAELPAALCDYQTASS
jgi:hypothetical protein